MAKTFTIQLGSFKADYVAYETRAPLAYDGFGTISIHLEDHLKDEPRWVLIRTEHEQWQTARYSSGGFTPVPFDSELPHHKGYCPLMEDYEQWIVDTLYKRMAGGAQ